MPTKDRAKNRAAQNRYYQQNKEYYKKKIRDREAANAVRFSEFKAILSCKLCEESDPCTFDFHHLDPQEKEYSLHELLRRGSGWNRLVAEIRKCVCLCCNCHRKVHAHQEIAAKLTVTDLIQVL